MKQIAIILITTFLLSSCRVTREPRNADHSENAVLISFVREASNKATIRLETASGKGIIYHDKTRGLGRAEWKAGDKYTVYFNAKGEVIKILRAR